MRAGFDAQKPPFAEGQAPPAVFERIVALAQDGALVMGLGNIGGGGVKLAAFFDNRARLPEAGP